jgi:hypothetical protein
MRTQTIFSDPMTANSIACAISRRSTAGKPGFLRMILGWAKDRLHH